jgi:hypothetical protein
MRSKILSTALAAALVGGSVTPARANLWTGACALRVTVDFGAPVRPPLASPTYDLDIAGLADLDLTTTGIQPCATTLTGTHPFTGTSVSGSGFAPVWSCAATIGSGSWSQSFDQEGPAPFSGSHTLTGSWGAWTLEIASPTLNVVGVGEFTLQAVEAGKTPQCATGSIDSVTMVGEIVFQDP